MTIPNTSATGGPLSPVPPILPLDDAALDSVLQALVVGITSLPGSLVRPRWQPVPPKQPEPNVNWCAIGVTDSEDTDSPCISYDPVNNVEDYLDDEVFNVLASFYGPNAQAYMRLLKAGLNVPQNLEVLLQYSIRFTGRGAGRTASELVNQQWRRRYDLPLSFRRRISLVYGVENILSATVNLIDDTVVDDVIQVEQNEPPPGVGFVFGESDFGEGVF